MFYRFSKRHFVKQNCNAVEWKYHVINGLLLFVLQTEISAELSPEEAERMRRLQLKQMADEELRLQQKLRQEQIRQVEQERQQKQHCEEQKK